MLETLRTQVLDAIAERLRTMPADEDVNDPYGVSWSFVTRDPIGELSKGKLCAAGVYGLGTERRPKHPFLITVLNVVVEVHAAKQQGTDMSTTVERLLGAAERRLKQDITLGGLVHDLNITGDQVSVDGSYPNQAEGALFIDVLYTQRDDDPRKGR